MMATVNVHGTRTTNTLSARTTERKSGVDLILYLNKSVEEHWTALLGVHIVGDILGFVGRIIWVRSVDVKSLHV